MSLKPILETFCIKCKKNNIDVLEAEARLKKKARRDHGNHLEHQGQSESRRHYAVRSVAYAGETKEFSNFYSGI